MENKKQCYEIHDFHLVLREELKVKIEDLSEKLQRSLSDTAIYIIERSLSFYKKIHFTADESPEFSKYKRIWWNEEMHIYFDKNMYRKIKHLSDTHMAFSVAIVVRWLFNYFFNNLYDEKKNEEDEEKIDLSNNEVEEYEKLIKCWKKSNSQLEGCFFYNLSFNEKFAITGFNFVSTS